MGKALIIAEKPSVGKEIANALGGGFRRQEGYFESDTAIISYGMGHLVERYTDLASTTGKDLNSLPILPDHFDLRPIDESHAKKQLRIVTELLKRADVDTVVNACDAGREGELIFRLIYEYGRSKKPMKRMWLQSMTAGAIREAYANMKPGRDYDALADSAKSRADSDWLIGINVSRAITRLWERLYQEYQSLSAGRVQTPVVTLLVNREREIKNFVPRDFWEIIGTFGVSAGQYTGKWIRQDKSDGAAGVTGDVVLADNSVVAADEIENQKSRFFDKSVADAIVAKCLGVAPTEIKETVKPSSEKPPKLYDLITLQREANRKYKISAKKTERLAQALYDEHKLITYPRTDAQTLPEDYIEKAQDAVASLVGTVFGPHAKTIQENAWIKPTPYIFNNDGISDHFAIIPSGESVDASKLSEDEKKIYKMIVQRFLAVFYPAAEYRNTTRITVVAGEHFQTKGKVMVTAGWKEVYGTTNEDAKDSLVAVNAGEQAQNRGIDLKAGQTKPPSRYTEDTLLGAMESAGKLVDDEAKREAMKARGLGTPATRGAIIEGLQSAHKDKQPYAVTEGKEQYFVPTAKAFGLVKFLEDNDLHVMTSPDTTGEWEFKLRLMEQGKISRSQFMAEIHHMTTSIIEVIRRKAGEIAAPEARILSVSCPRCGSDVLEQSRTLECKSGCGFKLWREVCNRKMSAQEAETLIRDRKTALLDGFVGSSKKPFKAHMVMNDQFEVKLEFAEREPGQETAFDATCPKCKSGVRHYVNGSEFFACEKQCGFRVYRNISGRNMSDDEIKRLITDGYLPPVKGFVSSRTKSKFGAALRLAPDFSKVNFEFEK